MTADTHQRLFPDDGIVTELSTKAAEEVADVGTPAGGTLATLGTALSAVAAAGALLLLPGLGVVIAGPVAAALTGAAAAGITGGLIGALLYWGIPEARAKEYQSGLEKGGILLGVKPRSDEDARYFEQQWKMNYASQVHA